MAGAIKHMERSRRSHRNNTGVFSTFQRNSYRRAENASKRQSLTDLLKSMLAPHRKSTGGQ